MMQKEQYESPQLIAFGGVGELTLAYKANRPGDTVDQVVVDGDDCYSCA